MYMRLRINPHQSMKKLLPVMLLLLFPMFTQCNIGSRQPVISVDDDVVDMDTLFLDISHTKEHQLYIKNLGDKDLLIDSIATSCLCMTATPQSKTIRGGDSTLLDVRITFMPDDSLSKDVFRELEIFSNDSVHYPLTIGFKLRAESKH